jgi:ABC-type lipoprotein release transport system permease subunit
MSQLAHRPGRLLALAVGILVASVSFTLLTSAANTSELQVRGTVARNFRPAYDILVRPRDSFTPLEREKGLIQANYLSGIFGGITFAQYYDIRAIPGVEVAAPIANIGYIMPFTFVPVSISDSLSGHSAQLYRVELRWLANGGASSYPDSSQYVYYTPNRPFETDPTIQGGVREVASGGRKIPVCSGFLASNSGGLGSPFQLSVGTGMTCFSAITPGVQGVASDFGRLPAGQVGVVSPASFPILLSAIDPTQERELVGLDHTLVSGRMLTSNDGPVIQRKGPNAKYRVVPVIASTRTYVDESLEATIERLDAPVGPVLYRKLASDKDAYRFVTSLPGRPVGSATFPAQTLYRRLLRHLEASGRKLGIWYSAYWSSSHVRYDSSAGDQLVPETVHNPPFDTFTSHYGPGWAPWENRDVQFRKLVRHNGGNTFVNSVYQVPAIRIVGRYDPEELPGFSPLSQVPLETYYPPSVEPADAASRTVLGDRPLLPTQNLGGYVAQPPLMLTTLKGLKAFVDPDNFQDADPSAPISVIRVRVAGVTGADPLSRERIKNVAQAIHDRTGLAVDITAGSSPHPLLIRLPAGRFGQPPLLVREGWVQKGVAVRFLDALDRKSLALFALILVICGFFLANGTFAAVRARRSEIGTLLCLGWGQGKIFGAVLGEVALVGLVAGIASTAISAVLVAAFSLDLPLVRTLLAVPVAVTLATIAGILPAWRASRGHPMDAIRPAVSERDGSGSVRRVGSMALSNLRRVPSRTILGALGLVIGVAALTVLLAINRAFQGVLVGTLLGNFVSVQVRGVDLASVGLVIALSGLSLADVVFLNLKERQAELVTLRTTGWQDRHVRTLVAAEGLTIGALGSLVGVAIGVAISSLIRGIPLTSIAFAAALAGGAGILVAAIASVIPLVSIERLMPPTVLAEEY